MKAVRMKSVEIVSVESVVIQPAVEMKTISVEKFKEQKLHVGQQCSFTVKMKGNPMKGEVFTSVMSPCNVLLDSTNTPEESGDYVVHFVPRELGDHLINVQFDGEHIPGSPFIANVSELENDPSKVVIYGAGLTAGLVGELAEFTVNTVNAGSGALSFSIDGPSKVKMNCVEVEEGIYKVTYNPSMKGVYKISVCFAEQQISGDIYKVHIVNTKRELENLAFRGDASKCKPEGVGLQCASIGETATFTVDASDAGRSAIMVGVDGPVIPAKQISVKHMGNYMFQVKYILDESGDYTLHVLWAGKHIPGSPFHVTV